MINRAAVIAALMCVAPPLMADASAPAPPWHSEAGVCVEVLSTGVAGVRVVGRDLVTGKSLGFVMVSWGADGKNAKLTAPIRTGLQARHTYHGSDANGFGKTTVWIPVGSPADVDPEFTLEILDEESVASRYGEENWTSEAPCASAPSAD